jgi:hypothetical protein
MLRFGDGQVGAASSRLRMPLQPASADAAAASKASDAAGVKQ